MRNIYPVVQSPRLLIIFEAAARLSSFTRAAKELHMQQPSVSAAIKQLEEELGVPLFTRGHRQITMSVAGQRLYSDVSRALNDIDNSISAIKQMNAKDYVTISSSSAFSYYWMMPRLHLLREKHPDIDLRMQNSDRDPELEVENLSLGIRLGDGNWSGYQVAKLANEIIYPVASPQIMITAKNLRSVPNLLHESLIHLEEPIRERPTWNQWFEYHKIKDYDLSRGLRLNDYALVLQAAVSSEGFAFGWDHIVRDMISNHTLSAKRDWAWNTGRGIYLIWPKHSPISKQAELVRDWIISVSDFPNA